jgi:hypothetical protein
MGRTDIWPNCYDIQEYLLDHNLDEFKEHICRDNWIPLGDVRSIEQAMEKYSPLAAIIIRMSEMLARGCVEVLNRNTLNYTRGQYKTWDKLIACPNPYQTRGEFLKQLYSYVLLNGFCYAYPVYASGFPDVPAYIYLLPPENIDVKPIKNRPYLNTSRDKIRQVFFTWNGEREELDERELILFKDSASISIDNQTLLPKSRIRNLRYPISNGIGSMESRNSLIYDRGANGIISNDVSDVHGAVPIPKDEIEKLEKRYKNRHGLLKSQMNVIITKAALRYTPMTFNVEELGLHTEHVACIKDCCDMLGYQYRLLSTGEGATFDNAITDKKSVYNDAIIPQAESLLEMMNLGLKTIDKNIIIKISFEHLYIFQSSEKERGEGRKALNDALKIEWDNSIITKNMWLLEIGRDIVGDINDKENPFNKYKFELTPEELGIIIDNTNNNTGNENNNNNKK